MTKRMHITLAPVDGFGRRSHLPAL